jgi:hypothetical protein
MPCLRLKSIGLLKNEVQVNIREALIRRIRNTAAKKSIKQLVEATSAVRRRSRKCLEVNGGIF